MPDDSNTAAEPYTVDLTLELEGLVGCWFWRDIDNAKIYHGIITASLEGGYYMLRFDDNEALPSGVHEVVNIERMARECWSIFEHEAQLRAALKE